MSEKIDQFCEGLRLQLTKLEGHLKNVSESISAAPQQAADVVRSSIQSLQSQHENNMQRITEAKTKLEERVQAKSEEVSGEIEEWKANRELSKLEKRADKSEDYAVAAINFAEACILEADLATLEAIEARMDSDAAVAADS